MKKDIDKYNKNYIWERLINMNFKNHSKTKEAKVGKIEKDKQTIKFMVEFYCKYKLHQISISEEYIQLIDYACLRLEHCKYGENKPACKNCNIHCYQLERREKICTIMRWVGPRMFIYDPIAVIRHLMNH